MPSDLKSLLAAEFLRDTYRRASRVGSAATKTLNTNTKKSMKIQLGPGPWRPLPRGGGTGDARRVTERSRNNKSPSPRGDGLRFVEDCSSCFAPGPHLDTDLFVLILCCRFVGCGKSGKIRLIRSHLESVSYQSFVKVWNATPRLHHSKNSLIGFAVDHLASKDRADYFRVQQLLRRSGQNVAR